MIVLEIPLGFPSPGLQSIFADDVEVVQDEVARFRQEVGPWDD
jgi:hypothetical protein